jgi:hypothetical protein
MGGKNRSGAAEDVDEVESGGFGKFKSGLKEKAPTTRATKGLVVKTEGPGVR